MSKNGFSGATQPERREWASRIRSLRMGAGLRQEDLSQLSNVSRQTISAIEQGRSVPQEDVLRRILNVLGIETSDEESLDEQTEAWLTMIGVLIEAIPEDRRLVAVNAAIRVLTEHIKHPDGPGSLVRAVRAVGGALHTGEGDEELPYAADTQNREPDEDLRTP